MCVCCFCVRVPQLRGAAHPSLQSLHQGICPTIRSISPRESLSSEPQPSRKSARITTPILRSLHHLQSLRTPPNPSSRIPHPPPLFSSQPQHPHGYNLRPKRQRVGQERPEGTDESASDPSHGGDNGAHQWSFTGNATDPVNELAEPTHPQCPAYMLYYHP